LQLNYYRFVSRLQYTVRVWPKPRYAKEKGSRFSRAKDTKFWKCYFHVYIRYVFSTSSTGLRHQHWKSVSFGTLTPCVINSRFSRAKDTKFWKCYSIFYLYDTSTCFLLVQIFGISIGNLFPSETCRPVSQILILPSAIHHSYNHAVRNQQPRKQLQHPRWYQLQQRKQLPL
jgi:hypothetical protein